MCIGAGILVDRWLGIAPIGVLLGVALGLAASGYALYELAVLGIPDRGHIKPRGKRSEVDDSRPDPRAERD